MKAMVLAAGLGTRLRPLTNDRPKALVEVAGRTLLEITLARLREFGIRDVIINVHHFADLLLAYLKRNNNFGMRLEISNEPVLLDTGGGLKKAAWFFQDSQDNSGGSADGPFLLHNVDIVSTIDFRRMVEQHKKTGALATLAVQQRKTSRYLLFDEPMQLCGRKLVKEQKTEIVRDSKPLQELAFSGIHVISSQLLSKISEDGIFSIIDSYLRLSEQGEKITGFRADEYYWRDLGTSESIALATEDLKDKLL
jgi:NDP-sugar pyrophosphorylase family protein